MELNLIKILEDIQDNMSCGYCYPRKIISHYYIHNNLMITVGEIYFIIPAIISIIIFIYG